MTSGGDAGVTMPEGPLVVGFDDHDSGRHALRYAVHLATRLGAPLRVVHVIGLEDFPVDPDSSTWDEDMRRHERELEHQVRESVDLDDDAWSYRIMRGDPWQGLLDEAERVDATMVVVGQHTHAHLVGAAVMRMLGAGSSASVATNLVRHADRPILVVPAPPGEA